jgi:hypothetical protein
MKKGALGKRLGFEHFLKPLRSSLVQHPRPIVVLAPMIPADWYTCEDFTEVYFIQGSPISSFDLSRTSFELAHTIVVHQPGTAEGVSDPMMVDSDVIFSVRLIESKLSQTDNRPTVIVDLMFDLNHAFVPLEGMGDDAGGGDKRSLLQASTMKRSELASRSQTFSTPGVGKLAPSRSTTSVGNTSSDADKMDDVMGQQMCDTGFYRQPRFACGTLFVSSTVTSLVVNAMYNPSLAMLVKELISAHFLLVTVPVECHGWTYQKFFEHLLQDRDLMSLAIVRRTDAIVPAVHDKLVPVAEACGKKGALNHRYVQTAPAAHSRIVFGDQILCVPPNTNDCAMNNPT